MVVSLPADASAFLPHDAVGASTGGTPSTSVMLPRPIASEVGHREPAGRGCRVAERVRSLVAVARRVRQAPRTPTLSSTSTIARGLSACHRYTTALSTSLETGAARRDLVERVPPQGHHALLDGERPELLRRRVLQEEPRHVVVHLHDLEHAEPPGESGAATRITADRLVRLEPEELVGLEPGCDAAARRISSAGRLHLGHSRRTRRCATAPRSADEVT